MCHAQLKATLGAQFTQKSLHAAHDFLLLLVHKKFRFLQELYELALAKNEWYLSILCSQVYTTTK
jgi:hypothetical protein